MGEQNGKQRLEEDLQELRRIRDEIHLSVHLASMDAKDRWNAMEPDAEKLISGVSQISHEALRETVKRFRTFLSSVRRHARSPRSV